MVGMNVRRLRNKNGISITRLAYELNMTHQQLQKIETGVNRLSAARLFDAAELLGVRMEEFFDKPLESKLDPSVVRLVQYYDKVENQGIKRGVIDVLKAAAEV